MRLREKILRAATPRAWRSAAGKTWRLLHPLPVGPLLAGIDPVRLEELARRYGAGPDCRTWPKYVDARRWLRLNVRRAQDLRLNRPGRAPLRVLDLGSGAGYFLYVCRRLGHDGLGLDLPEPAFYGEMFELLGLRRVLAAVEPFRPLPAEAAGPFDLVTAFSIKFNGHDTPGLWGPAEWGFLLDDLAARLAPGGRVFLDLNPNPDGSFFDPALRAFFLARGARLDRSKVTWSPVAARGAREQQDP